MFDMKVFQREERIRDESRNDEVDEVDASERDEGVVFIWHAERGKWMFPPTSYD
jgi:hypothetical protein